VQPTADAPTLHDTPDAELAPAAAPTALDAPAAETVEPPAEAAPAEPVHTLTGDVRRHEGFRSCYLAAPHDVLVYLPPGYDREPHRRYPVLYLQDGQNLFDEATAFSHEWQVDETAERLIAAGEIAPVIIVGIANAGEGRMDEYTPTRDRRHHAGGGATRYGRMLVEELKPFVDATYRTLPDPAHTGLGGSSLGGLLSLFLGLQYPGLFWRLAVLSPSVWWDDRFIVRRVRLLSHRPPLRIWLSVGTDEAAGVVEAGEALRDALVAKGWREGEDLEFRVLEGARHEETAWAALMEPVLKYLFPVE
jgi:predicted alpha/beta superfamily hydrolase